MPHKQIGREMLQYETVKNINYTFVSEWIKVRTKDERRILIEFLWREKKTLQREWKNGNNKMPADLVVFYWDLRKIFLERLEQSVQA